MNKEPDEKNSEKATIISQWGIPYDFTNINGAVTIYPEYIPPGRSEKKTLLLFTPSGIYSQGPSIPLGCYNSQFMAERVAGELRFALENKKPYTLPSEREENMFGQLSYFFSKSSMTITTQKGEKVSLEQYKEPLLIHDSAVYPASEKGNPFLFLTAKPIAVSIDLYTVKNLFEAMEKEERNHSTEMAPEHTLGLYKPDRAYIVGCALTEALDKRESFFVMPKDRE